MWEEVRSLPHWVLSAPAQPSNDWQLSIRDMFIREHAIAPISCVCG